MKKLLIGLTIFYLVSLIFFFACNSNAPTGPDGPDDNEVVEHHDYTVTYIRPQGSIVRPGEMDPISLVIYLKNDHRQMPEFTKISDYEFTAPMLNVPTHLKKEANLPPNRIYVVDPKRWIDKWMDENWLIWGRPHSVGDTFKLKNNKTGEELILTNFISNPFLDCPTQCEAKMAQFWTVKGGLIKNAWPY